MSEPVQIEQQFEAYSSWRKRLFRAIGDFRQWLHQQELADIQTDQRIDNVLSRLRDDKLYIAFVAEFSRGKSELINAIFFANFGQRVLPSAAGRTTMCPTELQYEPASEPAIRLLPIETRASGTTVSEFKGFLEEWTSLPLDIQSPDQVNATLQRIVETQRVPREVATGLGLHVAEDETQSGMTLTEDGLVEIPRWRHAIINIPHPLLEQGLVILDTPGLNALGAEPELTLSLLPSAHAILFVLAADAGVTKSDIEVWHHHIGSSREGQNRNRLIVLNKIDGLWDELRNEAEVEREIQRQVRETARHLGVNETSVYPVSAQKALLGKVRKDHKLVELSRIGALEDALANRVLPAKHDIVHENVGRELDEIASSTRLTVMQRLKGAYEHIEEIESLSGRNMDVIDHMMSKVRVDKEHFEKNLQRFQAIRSVFSKQTNLLYTHLDLRALEHVTAATKRDMEISMTTGGLRTSMEKFFGQMQDAMDGAARQAHEIKELMDGVYEKFQEEHGLAGIRPAGFSVLRYQREIKRIQTRNDQFMHGLNLMLTEQRAVVRKFFDSAVARVRAIFQMANRDADTWLRTIMSPMESQVREHQIQLRRRLESIKRIHQATDTLESRLLELRQIRENARTQEKALEDRLETIRQLLAADEEEEPEVLVAGEPG